MYSAVFPFASHFPSLTSRRGRQQEEEAEVIGREIDKCVVKVGLLFSFENNFYAQCEKLFRGNRRR